MSTAISDGHFERDCRMKPLSFGRTQLKSSTEVKPVVT